MADIDCPECPETVDPRGAWSHLVNKHDWDSDRAREYLNQSNSDDSNNDSDDPDPPATNEQAESTATEPEETAVVVTEEGSEKLSPDGFESKNRPEVSPPDDTDLPENVTPDDFEPDEESASTSGVTEQHDDDESEPETGDEANSGGLMARIRNDNADSDDESGTTSKTQEIIDDAPDEETRQRRQELKDALDSSVEEGESRTPPDSEENPANPPDSGASEVQGAIVSDALLGSVCTMPFHSAAKATGWEGWELDDREREKLQELIVAWADEKDVDLGPNLLLAMSLTNIVGSRAVGYARYRKSNDRDSTDRERESGERDRESTGYSDSTERAVKSGDDSRERPEQDTGQFNFEDSETWP
ncbi:membrane-attack complex/perforin family protein [Halorussus halophilus]|uniref:hypothetical protein n=1 Tax=Halorussus halophilus TaxID=2650975 RepID=UPI0013013D51|nr:hypothetical protein [Halorussus halophilus]